MTPQAVVDLLTHAFMDHPHAKHTASIWSPDHSRCELQLASQCGHVTRVFVESDLKIKIEERE